MHISCEKKKLLENINIVQKCVSPRTPNPILECILLIADRKGFRLLANDLEMSIETSNIEDTDVYSLGEAAINAKMLFDIVRSMDDGVIDIDCDENMVTTVKCGKSVFKIQAFNGDEFPRPKEMEEGEQALIKGDLLKSMIRQTIFSVSTKDIRPVLTGELFEFSGHKFNIVAVDGHRIAHRVELLENDMNSKIIVPGKTLNEISRLTDDEETAAIGFNQKFVCFTLKSCVVTSRLLEGDFIEYKNMFTNDYKTFVSIDRNKLLSSLERCMLIISRDIQQTKLVFEIGNELLRIHAANSFGNIDDEIDIDFEGEELRIGFSPSYLIDICKAIDEEKLNMYFMTSLSPCIVKSSVGNENFNYLVLPVKL